MKSPILFRVVLLKLRAPMNAELLYYSTHLASANLRHIHRLRRILAVPVTEKYITQEGIPLCTAASLNSDPY